MAKTLTDYAALSRLLDDWGRAIPYAPVARDAWLRELTQQDTSFFALQRIAQGVDRLANSLGAVEELLKLGLAKSVREEKAYRAQIIGQHAELWLQACKELEERSGEMPELVLKAWHEAERESEDDFVRYMEQHILAVAVPSWLLSSIVPVTEFKRRLAQMRKSAKTVREYEAWRKKRRRSE